MTTWAELRALEGKSNKQFRYNHHQPTTNFHQRAPPKRLEGNTNFDGDHVASTSLCQLCSRLLGIVHSNGGRKSDVRAAAARMIHSILIKRNCGGSGNHHKSIDWTINVIIISFIQQTSFALPFQDRLVIKFMQIAVASRWEPNVDHKTAAEFNSIIINMTRGIRLLLLLLPKLIWFRIIFWGKNSSSNNSSR